MLETQDQVRTIFKNSGLNQRELAQLLNVSPQYICKIYNKKCNMSKIFLKTVEDELVKEYTSEKEMKINKIIYLLNSLDDKKFNIFYNFIENFIK